MLISLNTTFYSVSFFGYKNHYVKKNITVLTAIEKVWDEGVFFNWNRDEKGLIYRFQKKIQRWIFVSLCDFFFFVIESIVCMVQF